MRKRDEEIIKELEENDRAFRLLIGYGSANVFRDLNKRYEKLRRELLLLRGESGVG